MSKDKIIVSSSDAKYFELLKELFLSLKYNKVLDDYSFGVLNTGMNNDQIDSYLNVLEQESNRPQKPSFFLSNNTDFDWRDEQSFKTPEIGRIVTTKKRL